MRSAHVILCAMLLSLGGGCLYGRGEATTTTTHRLPDGREESITRTYSGSSFGASVPDITGLSGGLNGNNLQIGAGNCASYGNCVGYETVIFGQVAGGAGVPTVTFVAGGNQTVAPGAPVVTGVDDELAGRLAKIEAQNSAAIPALKQALLVQCKQILAHPEVFQDKDERDRQVRDCTESLKKHDTNTKSKED